jgi:hypothetical protein
MLNRRRDSQSWTSRVRLPTFTAAPSSSAAGCHLKDILAGPRDNVAAATGRNPFVSVGRRFQGRKALKQFVAASPLLKHILAKSPNQIWSEASLCPLKYAALAGTSSLRLLPLADAESPKAQPQSSSRANTPPRPPSTPLFNLLEARRLAGPTFEPTGQQPYDLQKRGAQSGRAKSWPKRKRKNARTRRATAW